jgi:hypothetical protein
MKRSHFFRILVYSVAFILSSCATNITEFLKPCSSTPNQILIQAAKTLQDQGFTIKELNLKRNILEAEMHVSTGKTWPWRNWSIYFDAGKMVGSAWYSKIEDYSSPYFMPGSNGMPGFTGYTTQQITTKFSVTDTESKETTWYWKTHDELVNSCCGNLEFTDQYGRPYEGQ